MTRLSGCLILGVAALIGPPAMHGQGGSPGANAPATSASVAPARVQRPVKRSPENPARPRAWERNRQQTPSVERPTPGNGPQAPNPGRQKHLGRPGKQGNAERPGPAGEKGRNRGAGQGLKADRQPALDYKGALQRYRRERHDRVWWRTHYTTIVFVTGAYYYWDAGYWFPAWGYDPRFDHYDYDGPIYCYGDLLPDQVIYNVQRALKELGYYTGGLSGSLSPATREAISAYQEDYGLEVTGAIDAATVESLGLD